MIEARKYARKSVWPQDDQMLWARLRKPKSAFDEHEKAVDWSGETWKWVEHSYGRWIGWLREYEPESLPMHPKDRITQFRVAAFGKSLRGDVSLQTCENNIRGLKTAVVNLFPDQNWQWLHEICRRLKRRARGSSGKEGVVPKLDQLYPTLVADLGRQMQVDKRSARAFLEFRDVLMVMILCSAPVRLKNLTEIKFGSNLKVNSQNWSVSFSPDETKTGSQLAYLLPVNSNRAIEHYINVLRQRWATDSSCGRLWITTKGKPLQYHSVYRRVILTTERLFQRQINPHRFRTIVSSFCRDQVECRPHSANAILGHRSDLVTGTHYLDGDLSAASRAVWDSIDRSR